MTDGAALHLRDVEVDGAVLDVVVSDGRIAAMSKDLRAPAGGRVIDGGGGALLPGLHDHHLHLAAMAARAASVSLGPPAVRTREAFRSALVTADAAAPADSWLRGVDYHESVAGDLDRADLDGFVRARPVRLQHRSGAMWLLNSAALDVVGATTATHPGIERDTAGRPTGRIYRADAWLRDRWPTSAPDFAAVGRKLATGGVTGVTDATPTDDLADWRLLAGGAIGGDLPCTIQVTGGPVLAAGAPPACHSGWGP